MSQEWVLETWAKRVKRLKLQQAGEEAFGPLFGQLKIQTGNDVNEFNRLRGEESAKVTASNITKNGFQVNCDVGEFPVCFVSVDPLSQNGLAEATWWYEQDSKADVHRTSKMLQSKVSTNGNSFFSVDGIDQTSLASVSKLLTGPVLFPIELARSENRPGVSLTVLE